MISVRLSEDEFSALQRLCSTTGARSVSDLTRDAMRALLNRSSRESATGDYFEEFRALLNNLDQRIEHLTGLFAAASRTEQEN